MNPILNPEDPSLNSLARRRPATQHLPDFNMPPNSAEIPRAGDGVSPSLSSAATGSSQSSGATPAPHYSYTTGHSHGSWPTPAQHSYVSPSSHNGPNLGPSGFASRPNIFNQQQGLPFPMPRNSQSPATGGEVLPGPPMDQVSGPFQTTIASGAGSHLAEAPPSLASGFHQPSSANNHAQLEAFGATRPASHHGYYSSQQSTTPQASYLPHSATTATSPNGIMAQYNRSLGSLGGHQQPGIPHPGSFGPYGTYSQSVPGIGTPMFSGVHQPGMRMSVMPPMGGPPPAYGSSPSVYPSAPPPQPERPFKCDQCVQSFSRNHDLKRHKRIHLSVKPFPCQYCTKSFSRKDALKRHRLVKGCEARAMQEQQSGDSSRRSDQTNGSPNDDDNSSAGNSHQ